MSDDTSNPELCPAVRESGQLSTAPPSVLDILREAVHAGVTSESVAVIERLAALYEHNQEKQAEQAFARAFNALQADLPSVVATEPVPNKDGSVRYRYAPYESLMAQVSPLLRRHGFTVTFTTEVKENRLIKTCTLQHVDGHKRANSYAVRIGSGPYGASETQADGAASTYARRGALCDCLNIVIEHEDDDARAEGGTITKAQAEDLQRRVKETGSNEAAFLKFAGAPTYGEIRAARFSVLDENLRRKERTTP